MKRKTNQSTNFFTFYVVGAAVFFVMFLLMITVNPAFAGDSKTYPGCMGVGANGGDPIYSSGAAISNPNTSSLYVYLPIINDSMTESITDNAWVDVEDRHGTQSLYCSLNTRLWDSVTNKTYYYYGGYRYSQGNSGLRQRLSWTNRVLGAGQNAHSYFYCHIPGTYNSYRSSIIAYHVNEN